MSVTRSLLLHKKGITEAIPPHLLAQQLIQLFFQLGDLPF